MLGQPCIVDKRLCRQQRRKAIFNYLICSSTQERMLKLCSLL
jgi:hypothetical protein